VLIIGTLWRYAISVPLFGFDMVSEVIPPAPPCGFPTMDLPKAPAESGSPSDAAGEFKKPTVLRFRLARDF